MYDTAAQLDQLMCASSITDSHFEPCLSVNASWVLCYVYLDVDVDVRSSASLQDNTIVIVGGGPLSLEVISAIKTWYPMLKIVLLCKGSHILEGLITQVYATATNQI